MKQQLYPFVIPFFCQITNAICIETHRLTIVAFASLSNTISVITLFRFAYNLCWLCCLFRRLCFECTNCPRLSLFAQTYYHSELPSFYCRYYHYQTQHCHHSQTVPLWCLAIISQIFVFYAFALCPFRLCTASNHSKKWPFAFSLLCFLQLWLRWSVPTVLPFDRWVCEWVNKSVNIRRICSPVLYDVHIGWHT